MNNLPGTVKIVSERQFRCEEIRRSAHEFKQADLDQSQILLHVTGINSGDIFSITKLTLSLLVGPFNFKVSLGYETKLVYGIG